MTPVLTKHNIKQNLPEDSEDTNICTHCSGVKFNDFLDYAEPDLPDYVKLYLHHNRSYYLTIPSCNHVTKLLKKQRKFRTEFLLLKKI